MSGLRFTEEEYNAYLSGRKTFREIEDEKKPKPSKYRNNKAPVIDPKTGEEIIFDSEKERDYYFLLLDREKRGEIAYLSRQLTITIQPSFTDRTGKKHRAITYRADFYFVDTKTNRSHIVDVKGYKTEVYRLKKKLLAYGGLIIEEV